MSQTASYAPYIGHVITFLSSLVIVAVVWGRKTQILSGLKEEVSKLSSKFEKISEETTCEKDFDKLEARQEKLEDKVGEKADKETTKRIHKKIDVLDGKIQELSESFDGYIRKEDYLAKVVESNTLVQNLMESFEHRFNGLQKDVGLKLDKIQTDRDRIFDALTDINVTMGRFDERFQALDERFQDLVDKNGKE